jgi:nucleoid-associated protein YejK
LFLSIEVSKAMQDVVDAREVGDRAQQEYAQTMVDYFTDQMNESNPILTEISEAMTEEGECAEKLSELGNGINWESKRKAAAKRKNDGNIRLMECSARYNEMMKCLRESRAR